VERLVVDLGLHVIGEPRWHPFEGGGVTGFALLSESHLTVHTFPEWRFAAFNLYHCGAELQWPWDAQLAEGLGAERVSIRTVRRGGALGRAPAPPWPPVTMPET
jgi:S-adenosylmethionine decarboxylase